MKQKIQLLLFAFAIITNSFAQTNNPTVLTIDGQKFSISEFNYIYTKNNKDISYKKKDLDAYMDLFIKYKLKVKEAKAIGYDTIPKLKSELKQYRGQLSQPYMIDKEKNEALIKEAYDRTKNEIRASHILIRLKESSPPSDTLRAYNKIMALRQRILDGEDFAEVAKGKGGSEDPSAVSNGGDLGYFTALQMVYAFEDAAFKTKIGDISMPVRTKFGYHIIKVADLRPAKGKIETAHIMILSNSKMSDKENEKAKNKIDEIYELLVAGQKFEDLAMKFSDDQSSKAKGGLLPPFGAGSKQRMVPIFEKTAYDLEHDGDYSKPVLSVYGWHIIKRIKLTPIASYEEMYRELKLKVERDVRAQKTKQSFINNLKKEYNFTENTTLLKDFNTVVGNEIMLGKWKKVEGFTNASKILFEFDNHKVTLNDFANYLVQKQRREQTQPIDNYIKEKYDLFVNSEITAYEDSQLEQKYPDFKTLIQEYQDGILIFEIMQDKIWNKASRDTVGLKNYYANHKSEFMYPTRYKGTLYACNNKKIAKDVYKNLLNSTMDSKEMVKSLNADSELNVNPKEATFNSETTHEFKKGRKKNKTRVFKKGTNKPFKYNGAYYVFDVSEILEPSQREFKDAKGLVTAAYQNELQTKWINELKSKSKIEVNKAVLYKAKKYK